MPYLAASLPYSMKGNIVRKKKVLFGVLSIIPLVLSAIIYLVIDALEEDHNFLDQYTYHRATTTSEPAESARLYEKLSRNGHPDATVNLAMMYLKGEGVTADPARAAALFTRAADQRHLIAVVSLARLYMEGNGVPVHSVVSSALLQYAAQIVRDNPQLATQYPQISQEIHRLQQQVTAMMPQAQLQQSVALYHRMQQYQQVSNVIDADQPALKQ